MFRSSYDRIPGEPSGQLTLDLPDIPFAYGPGRHGIGTMGDIQQPLVEFLPVPHPLDFDWRFDTPTRVLLLHLMQRIAVHESDELVFLGAPSLFQSAQALGMARRCTLLDACPATVSALKRSPWAKIHRVDILSGQLPQISAALVMADPPWYEEFTRAFLWVADQLVRLGGTVLLSTPPLGTRPNIEEESRRTVAFARELGLELRGLDACLRYISPPFEQNALRAASQAGVPEDWRTGVLARFDKVRPSTSGRPVVENARNNWMERTAFGVRLAFRRGQVQRIKDPRLVRIVDGDILDTVSRRDPRRKFADVWTSGNRVFACADTETLTAVVDAIRERRRPESYIEGFLRTRLARAEQEAVSEATRQVSAVLLRELEEYALAWGGDNEGLAIRV